MNNLTYNSLKSSSDDDYFEYELKLEESQFESAQKTNSVENKCQVESKNVLI